ncbi:MAG: DUF1294 domain-containing protein [Lacunisphaera sp.]|nr:DUF1294 domain-containing protein [Lacunisphaera sp.]
MALTGRILEWSGARGFGYLEHEGRRVFLHIRDFTERPRTPEPGDPVSFVLGADRQGRPCAQQAVFLGDAGRIKAAHFLVLVFLLLPGNAVFDRLGLTGVVYAGAWVALISIITYIIYAVDKRRARAKAQREPETRLHLLELLGGWPGAFFAQRRLRHKSAKGSYQFVFVLIIGLHQFLAIDALRGWPFFQLLVRAISKL